MTRFAILEHTGAPDDPAGRHFDLLVDVGPACRTWRLLAVPTPGGGPVAAMELPPHRLEWLDRIEGEVSGGRGFARRVDAGGFTLLAGDAADLAAATQFVMELRGAAITGRLRLEAVTAGWAVRLD
ncbi:MAG: hypothetical protein EBX36_06055 [Planctomycetia bacterium]|nr:hypothetical protein [Planctomycetia bacterium]